MDNKIEPKSLIYAYIDHESEQNVVDSLNTYLNKIGKTHLFQCLSYILKELVGNANKANLKRAYFQIKDLDILDPEEYEEGMKDFKEEIYNLTSTYQSEVLKSKLFVKIDFLTENNQFILSATNNTPILPIERQRINDRIMNAKQFKNIEEVLEFGLDTQEGAGFGLILIILTLRKIGLDENIIKFNLNERTTQVKLSIPLTLLEKHQEEYIAEAANNEINKIPQFPQHIVELQKLLSNPNASFADLSKIINKDPAMIADLLKIANSSLFMLPNKVKTIIEAVRQIGFKGVKNLVLSYSVQNHLMNKYKLGVIKKIMDHSYEVAFYAYKLAKLFKLNDLADEIYTATILHDLGKIIINALKPDIITKIKDVCNEKGISSNILENLTDGYNHSLIGARLAKTWNFPDSIVEAIKYHHIPLEASDQHKKIVYLIYLADKIYYFQRKEIGFDNINFQVLRYLKLTEFIKFERVFNSLIQALQKTQEAKFN